MIGMLRGTYHRLMESNAKTEDYVKDVEKYSMMYNKSLEDSQLIRLEYLILKMRQIKRLSKMHRVYLNISILNLKQDLKKFAKVFLRE